MVTTRLVRSLCFIRSAGGYNYRLSRKVILIQNNEKFIFGISSWVGVERIPVYFSPLDQMFMRRDRSGGRQQSLA